MSGNGLHVGLLGIGEMGAAIGGYLIASGHKVHAILTGRSSESRDRAREAGITPVDDHSRLAETCDMIFSVLPPAVAQAEARRLANAARTGNNTFVFVEANAVSPEHVRQIEFAFDNMGVAFVDGGIVGPPPSARGLPRLYLSGYRSNMLDRLDGVAFTSIWLGDQVGTASAFKMSYAAITKGVNTLLTAALLSAEEMDFLDPFLREFASSQPDLTRRAEAAVPRLPADAGRWIREMEEIRDTFIALGLPAGFHQAAADIMRMLDGSRFGSETRRTRDSSRDLPTTLRAVAEDRKK